MQPKKRELIELVRRVQKGNLEAFGVIYDGFFDSVYAYVFRQVRSHANTEDIVSQVFLDAFEKIGAFRWRGAGFAAWLFRIARNDVLDDFRRRGVRAREVALSEVVIEQLPAKFSVEDEMERMWDEQELLDAIDCLSEDQRQVMLLKLMLDFTNKQIAEVIDKNEGAVKALRRRALLSLRRILEGQETRPQTRTER
ncbi:MAG: sigma-70 family RNA polymerase sigma factor [Thermoleophilia bacterium]|nr:sigma-70 family RNA polymerase sigma factor [Thermoleophilia bacterium]